MNVAKDMENNY